MATEAELLARDEAARKDALDVQRSFVVQAPAGSGKTELLIQRYLALLATVDNPEEVLAITFTLKAAAEMRSRVSDALLRVDQGDVPTESYLRLTYDAASKVLARDKKFDWKLLHSPRRMRIQTLDAFSAGIARSLPVSSGLGQIGLTIVGEEMHALHSEAGAATLDWLEARDERRQDVERVLKHLDNNTGLYVRYVSSMLAARDQWLPIVGGKAPSEDEAAVARNKVEKTLADLARNHLQQLHSKIPPDCAASLVALAAFAADNLASGENPDHPLVSLAGLSKMPAASGTALGQWRAIAGLLLTKEDAWRRSVNKRDGFPAPAKEKKQDLYDVIGRLREINGLDTMLAQARCLPEPRYSDEQWSVLLSLFAVLRIAVVELRRLFDERGVSDHTEVALAAGVALGSAEHPGEMAMMLDYSIRHLLVDEMQDTSVGQYRLLEQLTAGWEEGDGRTLFCVGDPMQSIYRFRDADVGRFVQAQQTGVADVSLQSLRLRQNFRSGEHLVHWFNTVFLQVMPEQNNMNFGAVAYSESVPVESHQGCGDYVVHPLLDASPAEEADFTLALVRKLVDEYPQDSKCILVRSRTHLTSLLPRMRAAGIPYQAIEIDKLTDLPEIIDALALTRALAHEADRLAWLALLRGPWVGLTWCDLHALVVNDSQNTVAELITQADRIETLSADGKRRLERFTAVLEAHCGGHAVKSLRDRTEAAWFALGGPAMLQSADQVENVYRFFDLVGKFERVGTLTDISELERRLDAELVSTIAASSSELQIMTMHKAKGLQFDHVILAGLGRKPRSRQKTVLGWLSVAGDQQEDALIVSPVGPQSELENDPLHQYIQSVEKSKDDFELQRLLYVACTRAIKSLHLIGNARRLPDGDGVRPPDSGSLLRLMWPLVSREFERHCAETGPAAAIVNDDGAQLVDPVLRRLCREWVLPETVALPGRQFPNAVERTPQTVDYYWVGSAARHAGTIVHRWLQRLTHPKLPKRGFDVEHLLPATESWAKQLGIPGNEVKDVCERVLQALRLTLADEKGRWILSGGGHSEFALTGVRGGNIQSIVIDRIRIDDDGTHWIIDYKSSTHEGGNLDGFLQQEADRYREQLSAYRDIYSNLVSAPLKTALYFPLLQRFQEIDTSRV